VAIRLIGIDVDGTLLDTEGRLLDANRDAIHEAVAAGIHVALVTLIVSSGAVERAMDGSVLARRLLDRTVARAVLESTRPYREAAALVFDRDDDRQVVFESMDWEHPNRKAYWRRNRRLIAQSVPLEEALIEDPIQVMFNGAVEVMRVLAESLRREARGFAVSRTEYEHRDFSLIDITAPTATKGRALAWRAGQLGLTREEVMAVGDNFNDLEMLEFAGTPVVMSNAVDVLKQRGWHMTGHQNEAGLAQAIRRFALVR
jgi:hydroxymethylpyrimidine pyrophosphatase-like HAD family hydrolase